MNKALDSRQRFLEIDGVVNFRDLGGYVTSQGQTLRWQRIYRAGQLDRPTMKGIDCLKALNIATVVDLRFGEETQRYVTDWRAFPNAKRLEWQQFYAPESAPGDPASDIKMSWREALETGDAQMVREAMRVNYPAKLYSHQGIYKAMLNSLLEDKSPLVFHCAAGKDRTGVAAAIILGLLGVSRQDIINDYLLTQQETEKLFERYRAGGATGQQDHNDFQQQLASYPQSLVAPVFEADPNYIRTLLEYVDTHYQGFGRYAEQILDFGAEDVAKLKVTLLED